VDDTVGGGGSTAQAFQVFKITPVDLGTSGDERLGARIAARHSQYLMSCADQLLNNGRTNEPRSTCDENTHLEILLCFTSRS
jgi:hypothetical protein